MRALLSRPVVTTVLVAVVAVFGVLVPSASSAAPSTDAAAQASIAGMVGVAVGGGHSCGIDADDASLHCWGSNGSGQLGTGTTDASPLPVAVAVAGTPLDGKDIAEVEAGSQSTCARATDGTLACWGENGDGELGDGTTTDRTVPTAVAVAGTPLDGRRSTTSTSATRPSAR